MTPEGAGDTPARRGWGVAAPFALLALVTALTLLDPRVAYRSVPFGLALAGAVWVWSGTVARRLRWWAVGAVAVCVAIGLGGLVVWASNDPEPSPPPAPPSAAVLAAVDQAMDVLYQRPEAATINAHLPELPYPENNRVAPCLVDAGPTADVEPEDISVERFSPPNDLPARVYLVLLFGERRATLSLLVKADGSWLLDNPWDALLSRECPR